LNKRCSTRHNDAYLFFHVIFYYLHFYDKKCEIFGVNLYLFFFYPELTVILAVDPMVP
jgi:hypothetical protein